MRRLVLLALGLLWITQDPMGMLGVMRPASSGGFTCGSFNCSNVAVSNQTQTTTAQAFTITLSAGIAAGHTVIVDAGRTNTGDLIASCADNATGGANTYHVDLAGFATAHTGDIWGVCSAHVTNALASGKTITVTWTNASAFNFFADAVTDVDNLVSASWTDQTSSHTANVVVPPCSITSNATAATSQASEFLHGLFVIEGGSGIAITPGTGWALLLGATGDSGPGYTFATAWQSVSATGAQTLTGTCTGAASPANVSGAIVTYKHS